MADLEEIEKGRTASHKRMVKERASKFADDYTRIQKAVHSLAEGVVSVTIGMRNPKDKWYNNWWGNDFKTKSLIIEHSFGLDFTFSLNRGK